jgi:hypothetical protein
MTRMVTPFVPPASELPQLAPRAGVRKFTVDEYHRLIEGGFFRDNDKFELLEGWIVAKMPRTPAHDAAISLADEIVRKYLPSEWIVRVQSAVTLTDSEPEPDLAVVRGPIRAYAAHHPGAADIGLIVESSATSLGLDRADKGRIYARARIAVYWILNVEEGVVEVYTDPTAEGYQTQKLFAGSDAIPLIVAGQKLADVAAREFLP